MDNVIPFPSDEIRDWASWSSFVHDVIRRGGQSPEVAEHVLTKIRPLFDALGESDTVDLSVPGECVAAFQDLQERINVVANERIRRIFMERLKREIELYVRHGCV